MCSESRAGRFKLEILEAETPIAWAQTGPPLVTMPLTTGLGAGGWAWACRYRDPSKNAKCDPKIDCIFPHIFEGGLCSALLLPARSRQRSPHPPPRHAKPKCQQAVSHAAWAADNGLRNPLWGLSMRAGGAKVKGMNQGPKMQKSKRATTAD